MGEVTSAVIATSLVLIAVFVPVSFFPGTTGILYRQFSLTIAFSIAISAFNALTLSPALSAMFLRGEEARPQQLDFLHIRPLSRAFAAFVHGADGFVTWLGKTYAKIIHVALQLRFVFAALLLCGSWGHRLDLQPGAHRLHSAGGSRVSDRNRAGAAGLFTGLYDGACRPRAGGYLFKQGCYRRVFDHGFQLYGQCAPMRA